MCTGGVYRRVSAKARGISERSARTAASWSGWASRFAKMPAMALSVVSPPGGQQQAAERLDVLVAHPHAVDLGAAQRGQQVVARVLPALADDRQHVLGELHPGPLTGRRHLGVARQVAEEGDDGGVPAVEAGVVGLVQAQHVGDDVDRETGREVVDQVGRALVPEGVDQFTGVALDDRQELLLQVAAAEGGRDQRAADGVLAPAELEDRLAVHRLELPGVVVGGELAGLVLEDALDVLVARDDVALGRLVPDEGRGLPHHAVGRIGVRCELGREDVGHLLGGGHGAPCGRISCTAQGY